MKPLRRFSFTLWTLLALGALLPNIQAQNSTPAPTQTTATALAATTTTIETTSPTTTMATLVPTTATAVGAVVSTATAAPTTLTAAPTTSAAASTTSAAASTTLTAAPITSAAAPTTSAAAPTTSAAAPTTSAAAPTTSAAAPTTLTTAPTTSAAAPTTLTTAPTTSAAAPTTLTTAPTTSPAAPTTLTTAPTTSPAAPTTSPAAPTTSPAAPTTSPAAPTTSAAAPTTSTSAPTTFTAGPTIPATTVTAASTNTVTTITASPSTTATTITAAPTTTATTITAAFTTTITAAPTNTTAAPTNTTAAPTNPTAAPTNPTAAPTTMTAAPTTMTAAPTTMTAAPTTMTAAPTTMTAAPTTMTAAPTTMTAAPTTMTAAPTTMTAAPTTMTAAPTTTMAVPTTTTAEQTTRIKAPGNVSNLFVESITTSSVKVIWNKTEDARYRVYWKNGTITSNETVTENFKSITGLDPGVQYNITVTVVANDNVTEGLPNTKTVYTRPVKPVKVQVESRTSDNITITWALPEGRVDHYSVNISNSSSNYSNLTVNATRAVFSGLLPGRIFIFTVTAVAGTFTSTSDQFSFATYPLYVKSFNIYQRTNSSLYLQWNISEKMEGAPDISYAITYNHTNDSVSKNCSTDKTDIALDDLQPGTSYTISITTVGPEQLRSTPVTIYAYTLPNAVTNLNVNFVNTTSVQLSWSRQADYKNSYKYLVEAFLGSEQVYHTSTPNETASFNSLTPGTLYTFQVSTVYEGVKSTNASINKYTIPAQVSDLSVIGTTSSLSVSWTKAVGQVSSYFIRLYNGTNSLINNTNLTKETTQFRFEDLKPGVLYHVEVVTKSGPEENNIRVSNATFPNPPGAIMVDFQTNKSINFSWPLPANMGASQYFTVVTINGFNNTQKNWFLLENLESGSKYTVSVVTVGALNYTSTERSTQIYTRPNSVTGLTKTKVTTSSVTLEWNEPSSKPPFIYEVQLGSAVSNVSQLKVVNTTTTTFDGLESGSKYNFTVTTITEDHTQAESVTVFYYTSPHNVKSLKLDPDEEHINLTWNRPDQYKDTYRFFVTWQSREWTHARNTTTEGISYSITELTPGIEYNITIITKTSDGTESATQTVSSCTNASPVRNLTCNGPNNGDAKIILSWTKPKGNYSNFKFTVTNTSTLSYANGVEHTISNLTYHSIYGIEVETQSCGKPSTPQWKTCQTGVAKPPIPSGFGKQMSKTHNTFTLRIQTGQINNSKGPVTHIGILVTSDDSANITDIENFLGKTYSEWRAKSAIAYLATVMNYIQTLQRSSVNLDFEIGNGSKWEGYANDALDPTGSYRYAVVVCTYLVVKSGKIDTVKSVCSISALSDVIILDKDPAITSTAIGATLGIFGVLFIILIGFIIYWKRLSRKESPDIQIESVGGKV
ncbi:receptor-type tyrosine-protein phosphatase eta-like isoform X2 [Poeciliopsis prolifica]|uniref:receptor-type tyrosine-protein phosphatase eta-like isoform X2 n=1 Tax=Poeciliopsis prolifica TaxID=188132 RepID=UPI0024137651|nr:receptor-type tyrosine-protein phosphatase eta-like isoform X2 [Poeciliopsis prolifica]